MNDQPEHKPDPAWVMPLYVTLAVLFLASQVGLTVYALNDEAEHGKLNKIQLLGRSVHE
jgi:hypothetical protein